MRVHLSSGPARVVASGMATTFFGHPLTFRLSLPGGPFEVRLTFRHDPAHPEAAVASEPTPTGLSLELTNFGGTEGRGSAEPVLLGELGDALLFLHFRAFVHGTTDDHTVHYTFFHTDKEAVDFAPASTAQET